VKVAPFKVIPGSRGITLDDVAHIMIPGRGRDEQGAGLSTDSRARVSCAVSLYTLLGLADRNGRLICSGYKSPADTRGARWSPPGTPAVYHGVPEADAMRDLLVQAGIPRSAIGVERNSIDTVTNFARSEAEGHFGDGRPTAVVAQEAHLHRILTTVAPRTLRRGFIGVVAPAPDQPDVEGRLVRLTSRLILLGITPTTSHIVETVDARARRAWKTAAHLHGLVTELKRYSA
jgi:uncharacterized SAM-binding protein YcdF (DUF218 family)